MSETSGQGVVTLVGLSHFGCKSLTSDLQTLAMGSKRPKVSCGRVQARPCLPMALGLHGNVAQFCPFVWMLTSSELKRAGLAHDLMN